MKIYLLNLNEWDAWFDGTPCDVKPPKCQPLYKWAEDNKADIVTNLCYFNTDDTKARKENAVHNTVQYLRIQRYNSDCGYGQDNVERMKLPNGDIVGGYTCGVKNGVVIEKPKSGATARNYLGMTMGGELIIAQEANKTKWGMCNAVKNAVSTKLLLEMDGGGSCGTYSRRAKKLWAPKQEGYYGRSVCSVLCLRYKGPSITTTLYKGIKGHSHEVELLQIMLGCLDADGIFGKDTKAALVAAQKRLGLTADGIAGPITLKALGLRR